MDLGDNYPELPVPMNSRRIALGFRDLDARKNLIRVVFINADNNVPIEEIADRFVLGAKLLAGMTVAQLREALNRIELKVYYTPEE